MLQPGQEFAHFRIIRELGSGGMGAVFLAEDLKLNREVALKVILAEYFDDAERLHRFQREARTAAQISHPNVMGIFDIGAAPDPNSGRELEYIVMERVKGIPLGEYFQSKNPDIGGVIRIGSRIAAGLAAAHKLNIAHRDIKASNILIDEEGNPKILDFGLAKPVDPVQFGDSNSTDTVSQELTRAGKIVGTVSYMSPEQAKGEPIDVRTDIFSFGVLLYRMVTGEFPFAGQSQVSTLAKILEARHEPPRMKNENVPPELERIIDKCLQKDANDRYQSAADLAVDLRNLRRQFDSGVTESISGEFRRTKTWKLQGKSLTYAVILPVVLVVAALAAFKFFGGQSGSGESAPRSDSPLQPKGKVVAVFDFENKTGDTTLNWLRTGLPEILMTDLAQTGSITVISRDRVLDHLRADASFASGDLSEEDLAEIEQAKRDMKEAMNGESLDGVPGVREAFEMARVTIAGLNRKVSHADMVEAAQSLGASTVLTGAYFKMGDRIRIDARLEDAGSGQIVLAEKVVGDDPFALVDSLTGKIAASLNVSDAAPEQSIASVTTKSPEAYKLYLDGMQLFDNEQFDESIQKFESALRIDDGFALAYMRIGMAHAFSGRPQKGAQSFARARQFSESLPVRDRSLLDIYSDIWLSQQFDAATVKLSAYVDNYPDDNEARAFYGLINWQFDHDSAVALAHYDTVLRSDPASQLVLSWKGELYAQIGRVDSAIACYNKIKTYHPDSPVGYSSLANLYRDQGDIQAAIDEYQTMTGLFPNLPRPWVHLSELSVRRRDFEAASKYLDEYKERIGDDPYRLINYEGNRADLANWQGKFRTGLQHTHRSLKYAFETEDSSYVRNAYGNLFDYYHRMDNRDSMLWALQQQEKWSREFNNLDVALRYAGLDPAHCGHAREVFADASASFKQRTPASLWPIIDQLQIILDGYCTTDTARIIDGFIGLKKVQQPGQGSANERVAGFFMVWSGRYSEGRDLLLKSLSGEEEVTSGFLYPYVLYQIGVAEHELGDKAGAKARFEEMLRYWGKAEYETKEIKDARKRLSQLTS